MADRARDRSGDARDGLRRGRGPSGGASAARGRSAARRAEHRSACAAGAPPAAGSRHGAPQALRRRGTRLLGDQRAVGPAHRRGTRRRALDGHESERGWSSTRRARRKRWSGSAQRQGRSLAWWGWSWAWRSRPSPRCHGRPRPRAHHVHRSPTIGSADEAETERDRGRRAPGPGASDGRNRRCKPAGGIHFEFQSRAAPQLPLVPRGGSRPRASRRSPGTFPASQLRPLGRGGTDDTVGPSSTASRIPRAREHPRREDRRALDRSGRPSTRRRSRGRRGWLDLRRRRRGNRQVVGQRVAGRPAGAPRALRCSTRTSAAPMRTSSRTSTPSTPSPTSSRVASRWSRSSPARTARGPRRGSGFASLAGLKAFEEQGGRGLQRLEPSYDHLVVDSAAGSRARPSPSPRRATRRS